jgi:bifunctional non-homologous end joining protein LigD
MIKLHNGKLINSDGEIYCHDLSPKFQNYTYDKYVEDGLKFIDPMTCKSVDKDNIPNLGYIAQEKFDGTRATKFITNKGNRLFSRRVSVKTNWFSENTDQLLHLRDYNIKSEFYGTVLDGELTMPQFSDVQGVTGALPETALKNQLEKDFAVYNAFDILYYKGVSIKRFPLAERLVLLHKVVESIGNPYVKLVKNYCSKATSDYLLANGINIPLEICEDFKKLLEDFWEQGKEGLIIKNVEGKYYCGKRSKDFLKLKNLITKDVVIMGYQEPTKHYDGKTLEDGGRWGYWECYEDPDFVHFKEMTLDEADEYAPITKPYAMGWIGSIDCGVYKNGKLVKVAEVKGISDEMQEYIKENREKLIGNQVIEIKCQQVINHETGSIRHPRFHRMRPDRSPKQCTWEAYIDG